MKVKVVCASYPLDLQHLPICSIVVHDRE